MRIHYTRECSECGMPDDHGEWTHDGLWHCSDCAKTDAHLRRELADVEHDLNVLYQRTRDITRPIEHEKMYDLERQRRELLLALSRTPDITLYDPPVSG